MALQIWLPLNNGNVINQGVADAELSVSANWSDIGKIGAKGFTNGTINATAKTINSFYNNKEMSFAFWVYINAPTGDKTGRGTPLIGNATMTPPNNRKFSIFAYPTVNDLHWSWQNDEGVTFTGGTSNGVLPSYKWTHVVFTYKDSLTTLYVNGVKKTTSTGKSDSSNFNFAMPILRCSALEIVNDLRIYDHCLSLKEVKEISKGLCLYLPMDDTSVEATENIIKYPTPGSAASYAWNASLHSGAINVSNWSAGYNSGVGTPAEGYHAHWKLIEGIPTIVFPDLNSNLGYGHRWLGISSTSPDFTTYIKAGQTYTVSFDARGDVEGLDVRMGLYYSINGTSDNFHDGYCIAKVTKAWKRYSATFTASSSLVTTRASRFYLYGHNNSGISGTSYVRNIQVELKDHATEYTKTSRPAEKVYDTSGCRHHGTPIGTISNSIDSPRNKVSYVFDGSTSGIQLPILNLMKNLLSNQCTINFWVYEDDTSSRSIYFGGYNGSNFNIEESSGRLRVYWNNSPDFYCSNLPQKEWFMVSVVIDVATGIKVYKNGALWNSHNAALTDIVSGFTNANFHIGKDTRNDGTMFEGKMSDFRIYATALSEEDINSLYKTSMATDDKGNSYSGQFNENEKSKFSISNGITYAELSELDGSGMEIKALDDNSIWARIHYLDLTTDKTVFANDAEIANCTNKNNRFSLMGRVDEFGKQVVLKNVFPAIDEATFSSSGVLDTAHPRYKSKSLKITGNTNAEVTSQTTQKFTLDNTHIYYSRLEMYQETANGYSQIYWPIAEPSHFRVASSAAGQWQKASARINRSTFTNGEYPLRVDYDCAGNSGAMWFDGIMLIDLTEAFGLGFEPTKAWCDENIPYFTGEKVISIENLDNFNFEFMLTYPSLSNTLYNRWQQSISPNHANVTTRDGVGYRPIVIAWNHSDYTGVLTLSNSSGSAKYSHNIKGNWWAPIGQKVLYNSTGIPAMNGSTQTSTELWVRIFPDEIENLKARIYPNSFTSNNFYER